MKIVRGEFESSHMKEMEVIAEYHTKVIAIVNNHHIWRRRNDEEITNVHVMEKVLQCLNTKFEIIAMKIEETKDLETTTIKQFIG